MPDNYIGINDEEFLVIAKGIKKFYKEEISEHDLIEIINSTSARYVETLLPNPDSFKLLKDVERIRNGKYTVRDVIGFKISYNDKVRNIYMDRDIIKVLALDGDGEEIEKLSNLETYEKRLSGDKSNCENATPKSNRKPFFFNLANKKSSKKR